MVKMSKKIKMHERVVSHIVTCIVRCTVLRGKGSQRC